MEKDNIRCCDQELEILSHCTLCPHSCGVNRYNSSNGWCKSGARLAVASVVPHFGEEPIISGKQGICNIFFPHCNLQCIYCQNYQISDNTLENNDFETDYETLCNKVISFIKGGCHAVGFVSPSHMVPHVKIIIQLLRRKDVNPVFVYNSNAYDKIETLQSLEGLIDVYLPDIKYRDRLISQKYSGVSNYPEVAAAALKEMYRQKGSSVITDHEGQILSGLIIRHLVLPGNIEDSKNVLRFIADEISPRVHISLMSQYYPVYRVSRQATLGRKLLPQEYREVVDEMTRLGLFRGWVQELESPSHYLPDFTNEMPFSQE